MQIQSTRKLTLTHEDIIELVIAGLKAKYKRRGLTKGLVESDVKAVFTEEVKEIDGVDTGTGRLESVTIDLPTVEDVTTADEDAAAAGTAPEAESAAK